MQPRIIMAIAGAIVVLLGGAAVVVEEFASACDADERFDARRSAREACPKTARYRRHRTCNGRCCRSLEASDDFVREQVSRCRREWPSG